MVCRKTPGGTRRGRSQVTGYLINLTYFFRGCHKRHKDERQHMGGEKYGM